MNQPPIQISPHSQTETHDPGAWSVKPGQTWDPKRFEKLLDAFGSTSSQTIAPDIARLREYGRPILLAAQDGLDVEDLRPHVGGDIGLAVGGSTPWKWQTLGAWCDLGREAGCRVHVLRANSKRMISWAAAAGATSFDGTGATKWRDCLNRMDRGRRPTTAVFPGFALASPFKPREKKSTRV